MAKIMSKKHARKLPDLILGPLPIDIINRTLGTELDVGAVIFSAAAQIHAAREHPREYPVCFPHVAGIIAAPLYIGDDDRNPGNIEMIGRVQAAASLVLVAVNIELDEAGHYHVCSFYPISNTKAENRKAKGFLRIAL
jgi:hypothetical protein